MHLFSTILFFNSRMFYFTVLVASCRSIYLYNCDIEGCGFQPNGDNAAGDRATSNDRVCYIFMDEESNSMFMSVLPAAEVDLVSFLC